MIVRMNGVVVSSPLKPDGVPVQLKNRRRIDLRRLAITLWGFSGVLFAKAQAFAADSTGTGLWDGMFPMFQLFQEVAMVIGALAIMAGLAMLVFRKRWGVVTIKTAAIVTGGVFLVPAAVMLLAIIGTLFNDRLVEVMAKLHK